MFSNEAFKLNNEEEGQNREDNFEDELASLRKKQIDRVSLPKNMEDDFFELKKKEEENKINPIELNRLKLMRNEYWTNEDQMRFLELNDKKAPENHDKKRFLELSKKQTVGELSEEEKEEIKKIYQRI